MLFTLVLLLQHSICISTPSSSLPSHHWRPIGIAKKNQLIQITVGVKYPLKSIEKLKSQLLCRSDPIDHPTTYGRWLSLEQVDLLVSPLPSSVTAAIRWLNISSAILTTSNSAFLTTTMKVSDYEQRVGQTLLTYQHITTGQTALRFSEDFQLPASIADHIDILSPSVGRFPTQRKQQQQQQQQRQQRQQRQQQHPIPNPIPTQPIKITPTILRTRYNLTNEHGIGNKSNNTQATANFLRQFVQPSDLNKFFDMFAPNVTSTTASKIIGSNNPSDPGIEAMLDSEYMMSIGKDVNTEWWFTKGAQPDNPQDEPWLKWLLQCANTTTLPHVFSASYTDFEHHVNTIYANRVNVELMKIAIRGTSLLMAAGDYGIGTLFESKSGYQPEFPASSPWITSVGGTAFGHKKTDVDSEEVWNDGSIGTGGGFSDMFPRPAYQQLAVESWFNTSMKEHHMPLNASWWNATGRAYPDLAALATPYQTICSGYVQIGTGTSASTPTMAGIISLLNEHRLSAGKSSLGFLNPLIYKVLGPNNAFRDVTIGHNPGFYRSGSRTRTPGFYAETGWDPASGWGTPNFPLLLKEVMQLP